MKLYQLRFKLEGEFINVFHRSSWPCSACFAMYFVPLSNITVPVWHNIDWPCTTNKRHGPCISSARAVTSRALLHVEWLSYTQLGYYWQRILNMLESSNGPAVNVIIHIIHRLSLFSGLLTSVSWWTTDSGWVNWVTVPVISTQRISTWNASAEQCTIVRVWKRAGCYNQNVVIIINVKKSTVTEIYRLRSLERLTLVHKFVWTESAYSVQWCFRRAVRTDCQQLCLNIDLQIKSHR